MLTPGQVVDRYTVEAHLGSGGVAQVYRVRHNILGGLYALKVLDVGGSGIVQRLHREGRLQATLRHPGIVAVHDLLEVDGLPALVLDYVSGPTLEDLLAEGPLPAHQIDHLVRQVAEALAHAHDQGVVHRDLRPSNILVEGEPDAWRVRVTDFGLAKALLEGTSPNLTQADTVVGSPQYMAPEQMRDARHVDRRADVYSLGCILYELLCGRPPFAMSELVSLYDDAKEGRRRQPTGCDLSEPYATVIDGALHPDPAARLPHMAAFLELLEGGSISDLSESTSEVPLHICPSCSHSTRADVCPRCGEPALLQDRYRLDVLIDTDGAVRTWRALDDAGQSVIIHGVSHDDDPRAAQLLEHSADMLGQLHHPQIPRMHASFAAAGATWLVRDLVPGQSLAELVDSKRFSVDQVLRILVEVLEVLAWLHARRPAVVHRDLRPSNLIRTPDGLLVVVGFTRVRDAYVETHADEAFVGRFGYAAPELHEGVVTPAADVYAVAATALALLAPPGFNGLEPTVDTGALDRMPPDLADLLRSMLRSDPEERPTAVDALAAVRALRSGTPPAAGASEPVRPFGPPPDQNGPRRSWPMAVAGVVLGLVVLGVVVLLVALSLGLWELAG